MQPTTTAAAVMSTNPSNFCVVVSSIFCFFDLLSLNAVQWFSICRRGTKFLLHICNLLFRQHSNDLLTFLQFGMGQICCGGHLHVKKRHINSFHFPSICRQTTTTQRRRRRKILYTTYTIYISEHCATRFVHGPTELDIATAVYTYIVLPFRGPFPFLNHNRNQLFFFFIV